MILTRMSLTDGLLAALRSGTTKQCEISQSPRTPLPNEPYSILYPLAWNTYFGTLGEPEAMATIPYQVTSVGYTSPQAQWMADAVRIVLLSRRSTGRFTTPITADVVVVDRRLYLGGGPDPAPGGLWQVAETYELEVSA